MEKYYIEFKRSYKTEWISISTEYKDVESAKKAVYEMMKSDFYSKDYDYEYRIIMKSEKQIGDIYHLDR